MLDTRKALKVKDVHFREGSFTHLKSDLANQWDQVPSLDFVSSELSSIPEERMSQSSVIELGSDELDDDETEKEYEVQAITSQRIDSDGERQYLVKWVGYRKSTWESADSMNAQVPDIVREYEEARTEEPSPRITRSSGRSVVTHCQPTQKISVSDSDGIDEEESNVTPVLAARAMAAWCL
jgi:hypothetical protein